GWSPVIAQLAARPSEPEPNAAAAVSATGVVARHRFAILLGGQTVSAFGDAFANVAMPLLVLRTTGSAGQMGVVVGLSLAFQLVGGVLAGPVVDRMDRRRLLIVCDCAQLALAGSIPIVW